MITTTQKLERRKYICSSDCAAVLGVDSRRTAGDVYLEKTADLDEWQGNDATDAGNMLERVVLEWAQGKVPTDFARDEMRIHPNGMLAANFDGIVPEWYPTEKFTVEAKTTGIVGPPDPAFGEVTEGDGVELPDRVLIQVHHGLVVAGGNYQIAWVPVLIGGEGFRLYRVDRSASLCAAIEDRCCEFVDKYINTRTPPPDVLPSLDVLKRVRREPASVEDVPDEVVDAWIAERAARLEAEKREEAAQAALLSAMKSAEAGRFSRGLITYFQTHRKAYAVEAKSYRQLRLKKG